MEKTSSFSTSATRGSEFPTMRFLTLLEDSSGGGGPTLAVPVLGSPLSTESSPIMEGPWLLRAPSEKARPSLWNYRLRRTPIERTWASCNANTVDARSRWPGSTIRHNMGQLEVERPGSVANCWLGRESSSSSSRRYMGRVQQRAV